MTHSILILFAHPAIEKSRVNSELIKDLRQMEGITFHSLYDSYPDFDIDVKKEQQLLLNHEIIAFMHPFYWYSLPALLKEWQDLVLEHGFAYGEEGIALKGKKIFSAITTAGPSHSYQINGSNRFTIQQLLAPVSQTAHLCGMQYLPPYVVHGVLNLTQEDIIKHAKCFRSLLTSLREGKVDFSQLESMNYLNDLFKETI